MKWKKLAQYFAGEMEQQEEQKMEAWIKSDPKRADFVAQLQDIWKKSEEFPHQLNIDRAWNRLSNNMDELEGQNNAGPYPAPRSLKSKKDKHAYRKRNYSRNSRQKYRVAVPAAAVAAMLIIAGLFGFYYFKTNESSNIASKQFITQKGELLTFMLDDGSKVMLHPESRIQIPKHFANDTRELYLDGEAYFEVASDSSRPFIVHSENAFTRVLGTKFLVRAWSNEPDVEVVVAEGKVALGNSRSVNQANKQEVLITRNQKGVLGADKKLRLSSVDNIKHYLGWTQKRLTYDNRPLDEIISELERWYSVDIRLEGQRMAALKLSAEINLDVQPIDEVLEGIALSLKLNVNRTGGVITLSLKE